MRCNKLYLHDFCYRGEIRRVNFSLPKCFFAVVKQKFQYNYISINIEKISIEPDLIFKMTMRIALYE